jgi:DNA polymerase-3 subunit epsilon
MFAHLVLRRPLAVLDLETTGTDAANDCIVEISVHKAVPDGSVEKFTRRVNPERPIPAAATAVHGITDADVAGAPRFADIADRVMALLDGCDLCGFNLKRFDLRLLCHEFGRAGRTFVVHGRALIDALEIYHTYEPRNLSAAVRFYLDRAHDGAHGAEADVRATVEVLDAMLARYADLGRDVEALHARFHDPHAVDPDGFFKNVRGEVCFARGKYAGQSLASIARTKPDYLEWMLRGDFLEETKAIARDALGRRHGRRPEAGPRPTA